MFCGTLAAVSFYTAAVGGFNPPLCGLLLLRRLQAEQAILETELVAAGGQPELCAALGQQLPEDGFKQLPASLPVGIGEGGAAADLAQGVGLAELTKQHRYELAPTGEPAQVAVGVMPAHGLLEFDARKQLQQL